MKAIAAVCLSLILAACAGGPREISFTTGDGGVVYADVYGAGPRGLLLAHGGRFPRESWREQAPVFARAGYRVLAIDFRGRGRSGGGAEPEGYAHDVLAAVRRLRAEGAESVYVIGASFGGGAAAEASIAAEPGEMGRLVLLAASPVDAPERMRGCKLFILARDDVRGGDVPRLPEIREQFDRAPEPKSLLLLDGAAHAQVLFETDQGPRLMTAILDFLAAPCDSDP
jgi:pimeloyl-ACP methyl ester carboxylesterase